MKKILIILILSSFSLSLFSQQKKETSFKFLPHWMPQAQFAGFIMAYEKGIYKKHGLDIELLTGGPNRSSLDWLVERKTDFCAAWLSSALQVRDKNVKLVNICQLIQRSALMLVAKKGRGINSIKDLNGKKVALWQQDFRIQAEALFTKYNLKVKVYPLSETQNIFIRDVVDVTSVMWYNEYHLLLNSGYDSTDLQIFSFSDYDLNFPEDGIYVLEDFYNKNKSECKEFSDATLEGWDYAFSHEEETLQYVKKYLTKAKYAANEMHQRWMLRQMKKLLQPDAGVASGELRARDYQNVIKTLKESGYINNDISFKDFFKAEYGTP
ncbi:MAG: ABC transporter substrate-binding protein [Ignavibacteria bacterium]|nr:ABC transporter substrate-binding protein [Ignavibacteria bacterium]